MDAQRIDSIENKVKSLTRDFQNEVIGIKGSPGAIPRKIQRITEEYDRKLETLNDENQKLKAQVAELRMELHGDNSESRPGVLNDLFVVKQFYLKSTAQINLVRFVIGGSAIAIASTVWAFGANMNEKWHELDNQLQQHEIDLEWMKNHSD